MYRRALAPLMTVTGVIGMGAALAGWKANLAQADVFLLYWLCVAGVALVAGLVLVRRQAIQRSEPVWSPPARRVARAILPPLFAGLAIGMITAGAAAQSVTDPAPSYLSHIALPLLWVILYGCAVHAAGFFMRRGIRIFGWTLIACACAGFWVMRPESPQGLVDTGYGIMGLAFGVFHAVYGLYLFATENRSPAE